MGKDTYSGGGTIVRLTNDESGVGRNRRAKSGRPSEREIRQQEQLEANGETAAEKNFYAVLSHNVLARTRRAVSRPIYRLLQRPFAGLLKSQAVTLSGWKPTGVIRRSSTRRTVACETKEYRLRKFGDDLVREGGRHR
jgi:hypothetical protein